MAMGPALSCACVRVFRVCNVLFGLLARRGHHQHLHFW